MEIEEMSTKTTKTLALAAALTLTALGSQAFAGEGSPDLSGNYPAVNESDPGGSNYGNTYGRFSEPYYTAPRAMYRGSYATPRDDENTGYVVRQNRYDDETGVDGE
jgi:hypothetical protein